MGRMSLEDMVSMADSAAVMVWHLESNHYPPVPRSMVDPCLNAIDHAVADEWDARIALPDGITWRGFDNAPVWAIVDQHHLQPFVDLAFNEAEADREREYEENDDFPMYLEYEDHSDY